MYDAETRRSCPVMDEQDETTAGRPVRRIVIEGD
jgi:hypothetical protein